MSLRLPETERTSCARIARMLRAGRRFLLTSHTALDGDSVGSELALASALEKLGKQAFIVNQDPVPSIYRFLPRAGEVRHAAPPDISRIDAAIVLDCGELSRIGRVARHLAPGTPVVNIDHHASNSAYGTIAWVTPDAAATGEMVFFLLREIGVLARDEATCLYAGILTDTGGFLYHIGPRTFTVAQELVAAGADPQEIARRIYFERPLRSLRLCSRVLRTLRFDARRRVCWVRVQRSMYRATGTREEDTEGILHLLRTVREADLFFMLKERADGTRVSLRSKGAYDVEQLARAFGGGGHREAAGCFLQNVTAAKAARLVLAWIDTHGRVPEH